MLLCGSRAQAGWASEGQLASITNFFDAGNDAFEVDAFPGLAAQGGWNTAWTLGFTAPQYIAATTTADSPLNGAGNYLAVTISNTTSSVAVRRQYASYFNIGTIGSSTNLNTFDVTYMPMRIRFDYRADSFTNSIYTNELSCVTNYVTCNNDLTVCTTNTVYSTPPVDNTVTTNVVCTPTGNRFFAFGTNNWSSRNDNLFISGQGQTRTSPNTDAAWVLFVQGDVSRVQDPQGPANKWLLYDGSPVRNDTGSGKYVDSGMAFTFGAVYHFDIITDPRDKTYTVQVDNGVTTNKVGPLRWRAYGDVAAVGTRTFLHFGGNCNDTNAVLNFSTDSISVEHLPPSDFPPFVSQLKPDARSPFTPKITANDPGAGVPPLNFVPDYDTPEFWPAGRGITFVAQTAGGGSNDYSSGTYTRPGGLMATARTTIPTSGIGLVLNGADVTGGLSISTPWGANFRKVSYNGLVPNTFYTGLISVTNSAGAVKRTRLDFNTLDETFVKVIEAEDYNYGDGSINRGDSSGSASTVGGEFLENSTPSDWTNSVYLNQASGYVDRRGMAGVDFSDTTLTNANVANNVYRFGDPVGTTLALDFRRSKYNTSGARDFQVSLVQPGEWLNYTRTFAGGTYQFYLRASSTATGGAGTNAVSLDYVTSDRTAPGQTTTNIGQFRVFYTGNAQAFTNAPLVDTNSGSVITVTLPAGVHTLRLTALNAGNNLQLNYVVAAPASGSAPSVAITSPASGASFSSGANISLTANATVGSQVEYFNGTTSLGTSSAGPTFPVTWSSVPTGRYSITAKATVGGFSSKSAAVNITVGSAPKKVLFVRGGVAGSPGAVDAGNLGGGDAVKKSIFASLGWETTDLFATNLNFIGGLAASAGFDMIAVSVSVQSSDINQNFRDVPVPLWNEEPSNMTGYAVGKDNPSSFVYGASGARGVYSLRRDAVGLAAAAGYPAGIYHLSSVLTVGNRTATLNENGIGILWSTNVTSGDSQSVFVWYYPAGAELFNGVIAPAVRYGWCNGANEAQVTTPMNEFGTNFMVEGLKLTMANPVFTGVLIYQYTPIISGTTVTVPFRGASYEEPANFSLWSSSTVDGTYTVDVTAVITKPDPNWNMFEATTTSTGPVKFYRVRRN
jgi:hypothetical protein